MGVLMPNHAKLFGTSIVLMLLLVVAAEQFVVADQLPKGMPEPLTVICIRHAEKVDGSVNAKLSACLLYTSPSPRD